ncbi:MAG: NAD(P)H dehydrogenase, partial [Candidatus Thorarchaeota archaeon]
KLEELGLKSEKLYIHRLVNREEKINELFQGIERADLVVLSFPLYVDSLPAPVIKAMELIFANKNTIISEKSKNFIAIANNGFPEASQNETALQICRIFSRDCGFTWKGGIAVVGGAIGGKPLQERGGVVRNVINGLDISAHALIDDEEIPQEAIEITSKSVIPSSLYRIVGNLGWKRMAKRYGAKGKLKGKPYANSHEV